MKIGNELENLQQEEKLRLGGNTISSKEIKYDENVPFEKDRSDDKILPQHVEIPRNAEKDSDSITQDKHQTTRNSV